MDQSGPTSELADNLRHTQFTMLDAFRRAQGEALDLLGFGPTECEYRIVSSGPHWLLRDYGGPDGTETTALIVPAPIKRPYIFDLAPQISAVRHCRDRMRVYLLEWIPPQPDSEVRLGLEDYAVHAIAQCVERVTSEARGKKPVLIGHSLGGTLAAIFCAYDSQSVSCLVLLSAPLCFEPESSSFRDALISLSQEMPPEAETVPGSLLSQVSALASPETFIWGRMTNAALSMMDPGALDVSARVERWVLDEAPLPGQLVAEIIQLLYREDRFFRGTLLIGDRTVGPSNVEVPTLAIVSAEDEIAPLDSVEPFLNESSAAEKRIIECPMDPGAGLRHLAVLAGARAYGEVWPEIFSWMEAHGRRSSPSA